MERQSHRSAARRCGQATEHEALEWTKDVFRTTALDSFVFGSTRLDHGSTYRLSVQPSHDIVAHVERGTRAAKHGGDTNSVSAAVVTSLRHCACQFSSLKRDVVERAVGVDEVTEHLLEPTDTETVSSVQKEICAQPGADDGARCG